MSSRTAVPTYDPSATTSNHHAAYRTTVMPVDDKIYSCQQVVDPTATKYPTYVDSSRGYVVPNSTKCLDVSWPYSVSPSSGIIQPIQVMGTQLEINHKECGRISKHSSLDGISSNHSSSPVNSGLITPKMEDIKTDSSLLHQADSPNQHIKLSTQNSVTPQHFSPVTTSASEIPRQTVLMWGSNHIHIPPSSVAKSPQSNTEYTIPSVQQSESCEPLKNLTEIGNPEICKWTNEENKSETVMQNGDPESPHQRHSSHHSHHNSRVVMVL